MCRMSACRKLQEFVILRVTACSNSFVDLNPFGLSKERGEELSAIFLRNIFPKLWPR